VKGGVGRSLRLEQHGPHVRERANEIMHRIVRDPIERAYLQNREPGA
jgi:hypothetical protein